MFASSSRCCHVVDLLCCNQQVLAHQNCVESMSRALLVNGSIGFVTFAVGDAMAQLVGSSALSNHTQQQLLQPQQQEIDLKRSCKVGLLGLCMNAGALSVWYRVLDRCIGHNRSSVKQVVLKVAADQLVYAPFALTAFLSFTAAVDETSPEAQQSAALASVQQNLLRTYIADWSVWPLANAVAFRYMPTAYRPSFISCVQLGWQGYMSSVCYKHKHEHDATVMQRRTTTAVLQLPLQSPIALQRQPS
jgi:Mpv17 / PMP22 family